MLILRCEHLGELLSPLPGAWLSGICLSCEATVRLSGSCLFCEDPGGTTTVAAASSPALESARGVTTAAPSPQGPGCSGGGALICSAQAAQRQECPRHPLHCWLVPVPRGVPDPGLCPPAPRAPRPALLESLPRAAEPPPRGAASKVLPAQLGAHCYP